ncbi:unnamed protein product [Ixodes pacificus]
MHTNEGTTRVRWDLVHARQRKHLRHGKREGNPANHSRTTLDQKVSLVNYAVENDHLLGSLSLSTCKCSQKPHRNTRSHPEDRKTTFAIDTSVIRTKCSSPLF